MATEAVGAGETIYFTERFLKIFLHGEIWKEVMDKESSSAFYTVAGVAIRELLQNAIDATRRYARIKQKPARDFPIDIIVKKGIVHTVPGTGYEDTLKGYTTCITKRGSTVCGLRKSDIEYLMSFYADDRMVIAVVDRGVGMTARDIKLYLAGVGGTSKDITTRRGYTKTISDTLGGFGLGFWSVSLIAEAVYVISRAERRKPVARVLLFRTMEGVFGAENIRAIVDENKKTVEHFLAVEPERVVSEMLPEWLKPLANEILETHGTIVAVVVRPDLEHDLTMIDWEIYSWLWFIKTKTGNKYLDVLVRANTEIPDPETGKIVPWEFTTDMIPNYRAELAAKESAETEIVHQASLERAKMRATVTVEFFKYKSHPLAEYQKATQVPETTATYYVLNDMMVYVSEVKDIADNIGFIIVKIDSPGVPTTLGRTTFTKDADEVIKKLRSRLMLKIVLEQFFENPSRYVTRLVGLLNALEWDLSWEKFVKNVLAMVFLDQRFIEKVGVPLASGETVPIKIFATKKWTIAFKPHSTATRIAVRLISNEMPEVAVINHEDWVKLMKWFIDFINDYELYFGG